MNRFTEGPQGSPSSFESAPRAREVFRVDPEVERQQIERVRTLRAGRSEKGWKTALAGVSAAARDGRNLVPPIIAAVEAKATVGEIADALRSVFGEYKEPGAIQDGSHAIRRCTLEMTHWKLHCSRSCRP